MCFIILPLLRVRGLVDNPLLIRYLSYLGLRKQPLALVPAEYVFSTGRGQVLRDLREGRVVSRDVVLLLREDGGATHHLVGILHFLEEVTDELLFHLV